MNLIDAAHLAGKRPVAKKWIPRAEVEAEAKAVAEQKVAGEKPEPKTRTGSERIKAMYGAA